MENILPNNEINQYFQLILDALNLIPSSYYLLPTRYRQGGIVRERVLCYELYHIIRCLQEERGEVRLTLNGEIDKRGHRDFIHSHQKNPDFVFHIPASHEHNAIVIEVKGKIRHRACLKDFTTLSDFIHYHQYKLGVFILYNHSLQEFRDSFVNNLNESFATLSASEKRSVYIVCKKNATSETECRDLFFLLE